MDWNKLREVQQRVQREQWDEWVVTARKPKDLVLKAVEDRLMDRLGLPAAPKGGLLSLGWVIKQIAGTYYGSAVERATPIGMVMMELSPRNARGDRLINSTATLVFNLMCHKELITKYGHNQFSGAVQHGDDRVVLFDRSWTPLAQDALDWLMLQSPFDCDGEYVSTYSGIFERLHNPNGPVITTSKGRKVYVLNNVIVQPQEWALRGNAQQIIKVQNVEVRRVLIEDMGTERFLHDSGMRPIHEDETGRLYRLDAPGDEWNVRHLCWVHVKCPSTDREYMLAVPPLTRTAREGVAWTFRKLPEEYNPQEQT